MRTAIFIPARVRSTRLPGKVLFEVKGKTIIEHLIERVKYAKLPDTIVLCTTVNPEDAVLVDIAKKCNIDYFRGSETDILDRYLNAAQKYGVDFIINVDGDDVFCDPELIDKTTEAFAKSGADFIAWKNLPLGASPCGVKVDALRKICELKEENDTETGWGLYFTDTGLFRVEYLEPENEELKRPDIRMTLDYPEDLEFVREIFNRLYTPGRIFTLRDILKLLEREPWIADINKKVQEEYWKRFRELAKVKLRRVA